jgi:hypothetical protein
MSISGAACTEASASRSSAWSHVAFSAMRLSASRSASFRAADRWRSTITGTRSRPGASAASSRPWPATSAPASSTSSGLGPVDVQREAMIAAASWIVAA